MSQLIWLVTVFRQAEQYSLAMWFNIRLCCGKALDPVIALGESQLVAPAACGALPCGPKAALLFFNLPKATQNLQAVEVLKS